MVKGARKRIAHAGLIIKMLMVTIAQINLLPSNNLSRIIIEHDHANMDLTVLKVTIVLTFMRVSNLRNNLLKIGVALSSVQDSPHLVCLNKAIVLITRKTSSANKINNADF